MINEIVNFVDELKPEVFTKNRELSEGLYLLVDIDQDGELLNVDKSGQLKEEDRILYRKKDEPEAVHYKLLEWQINSVPVSPNKSFDSIKKIFNKICSPYAIGFKKAIFEKNVREGEEKYKDIEDSIELYFKTASEYISDADKGYKSFKVFCEKNLISLVESLGEYEELNKNLGVYVLKNDVNLEEQVKFHKKYLSQKVFNKEKYNKEIGEEIFGISDSVSGFNRKKIFLRHQTAPLDLNFRVSGNQAKNLWKFFELWKNNQIPNPFPLFIDKKELNDEVVSIFNEDRKFGYAEIIKKLLDNYNEEYLSNYYLIFFQSGQKGSQIVDLDFVPTFRFSFEEELRIKEIFPLGSSMEGLIKNVFELEKRVVNRIFNGQLVQKTKKGTRWLKYFDDIEYNPNFLSSNGYNLLLKYRQAFYDYIYKSKRQAINKKMFDDIMKTGVLDDIRQDEMKEGNHTKGYPIKEKLNIWFSLYNFFDSNNQNSIDMIKTTKELKDRVLAIATNENEYLSEVNSDNDKAFAFAAGQVINKILIQSKSSNRSHALLEPFLQKAGPSLFKNAIARSFDMYKHEFILYPQKYEFDRIMGEVMGYVPEEKNMKNLLPYILAGYFSESIFKKKN